jgi:hypothetical protein
MSTLYKCKNCCEYSTSKFFNIKRHLEKKKGCKKKLETMFISNDQIIIYSLLPYYDNKHLIEWSEIEYLDNSNKIDKNKKELLNELDSIEKNRIKICKYCNTEFNIIMDLKKHILVSCFYKELEKRELNENELNNTLQNNILQNHIINNNSNNTNNTNNIYNHNQYDINNINIYLQIKDPLSFDSDWDISKISNDAKKKILISKKMYTNLLEEILNNEINLNVIIDKDKESGMVYKNNIDKYIQMRSKDIIANTMEKLNTHLIEINKDADEVFEEVVDFSRKMITKKYIDYQKKPNVKSNVEDLICNIYENKKSNAINIAKNIIKNKKKDKNDEICY